MRPSWDNRAAVSRQTQTAELPAHNFPSPRSHLSLQTLCDTSPRRPQSPPCLWMSTVPTALPACMCRHTLLHILRQSSLSASWSSSLQAFPAGGLAQCFRIVALVKISSGAREFYHSAKVWTINLAEERTSKRELNLWLFARKSCASPISC